MNSKTKRPQKSLQLFLLLCFTLLFGYSQEYTPDSLLINLNNSTNDSVRIFTLREIVNFWKTKDCDSTIHYSKHLVKVSLKDSNYNFAYKGYYWIINCYGIQSLHDSAMHYAYLGIERLKNAENPYFITILNVLAGEQLRAIGYFDKAIEFLLSAWKASCNIERITTQAVVSNRLAATYFEAENKEEALFWADSSITLSNSANSMDYMASNLDIKGAVLRDLGRHSEALDIFIEALSIAKNISDSNRMCQLQNNIATTHRQLKNPKASIEFAEKSFRSSYRRGVKALSVVSSEILSEQFAEIKDFESAYKYSRIYEKIQNEIFTEERDKTISELNSKYELSEKEKQIELNNILLKQKDLKLQQRNILSWSFVIILFLVLVLLVFRQWANKKLHKTNLELEEQKTKVEKQKNEIESAYEKLQDLDQFKQETTRMLVHDLKNPLNQLVNLEKNRSNNDVFDFVKRSSTQMLQMVLNLLDISKSEKNALNLIIEEIDLYRNIEFTLQELNILVRQKSLIIRLDFSRNYIIQADKYLFQRIFTNLLINAINHSDSGKEIIISFKENDNKELVLSVKDFGVGIAKENQEIVFESYSQINDSKIKIKGSTGIGLSFCKMATEAHGWKIDLVSELGRGAEFMIKIPGFSIGKDSVEPKESNVDNFDFEEITLNSETQNVVSPLLDELKKQQVFALTDIKNILAEIESLNIKELKDWLVEIHKSVEQINQIQYNKLIDFIKA